MVIHNIRMFYLWAMWNVWKWSHEMMMGEKLLSHVTYSQHISNTFPWLCLHAGQNALPIMIADGKSGDKQLGLNSAQCISLL